MKLTIWILFFALLACNSITTGDHLSNEDIKRIQQMGLLEKDEQILKFYSEFKHSVAGNFYSNQRLASYWQDEHDQSKNTINPAFYTDIISIDTVCNAGVTNSPYMLVMQKDSSTFKVCFDGNLEEIRRTFTEAINIWKNKKTQTQKQ